MKTRSTLGMRFLFTVEHSFEVQGRGCFVIPSADFVLKVNLRTKDRIQLRTPDAHIIETHISSLGSARCAEGPRRLTVSFGSEITKNDIPAGTEVWHESSDNPIPTTLA